ncbi:hypothetical protein QBC46DRAFT_369993 [Diplogelasinospora grovesii]|uniref:ClpX-type ZB domain-containing protein n=1 Tax=Diplogelasinospora grovesii TaxID=303347 RepID=A0AAN6NH84_9PEZI|nr:hypothetical protein QBC46DRAFT_369993 [Diplogelasinospora grovesii]
MCVIWIQNGTLEMLFTILPAPIYAQPIGTVGNLRCQKCGSLIKRLSFLFISLGSDTVCRACVEVATNEGYFLPPNKLHPKQRHPRSCCFG